MPIFHLEFEDGSLEKFDSDTSTFYLNEHPIEIEKFFPLMGNHLNTTNYYPDGLHKSNSPRFLRIVFGFNCNFSCKYCSQTLSNKKQSTSIKSVIEFTKKLCSILEGQPRRIELWGGEPLVYFKHIEAIMPILKERFPKSTIGIITNGSLINREIADFILDNKITVTFSHDAFGQHIRGEDPLTDPKKKALWLEVYNARKLLPNNDGQVWFGFVATVHKENCDITGLVKYFKKNFDKDVPVFHDYVTAMGGIYDESGFTSVCLDDSDLETIEKTAYENANQELDLMSLGCSVPLTRFLARCMHHSQIGSSICGSDGEDCLFVKVDGSIMQCQNNDCLPFEHGSVFDLKNARVKGATLWQNRESCSHCPFVGLCFGACPYMKGNAFVQSCHTKTAFYKSIFRTIVEMTYKKKLVAIHGDIRYPKLELIETPKGHYQKLDRLNFL